MQTKLEQRHPFAQRRTGSIDMDETKDLDSIDDDLFQDWFINHGGQLSPKEHHHQNFLEAEHYTPKCSIEFDADSLNDYKNAQFSETAKIQHRPAEDKSHYYAGIASSAGMPHVGEVDRVARSVKGGDAPAVPLNHGHLAAQQDSMASIFQMSDHDMENCYRTMHPRWHPNKPFAATEMKPPSMSRHTAHLDILQTETQGSCVVMDQHNPPVLNGKSFPPSLYPYQCQNSHPKMALLPQSTTLSAIRHFANNQGPYSNLLRNGNIAQGPNTLTDSEVTNNQNSLSQLQTEGESSQRPYSDLVKSSNYMSKVQLPSWISPNDVLQGNSEMGLSVFSNYAGNIWYRQKVRNLIGYYSSARNLADRKTVVSWVFSSVTDSGGRFLRVGSSGDWEELSSSEAMKKIMNYYQLLLSKNRGKGRNQR